MTDYDKETPRYRQRYRCLACGEELVASLVEYHTWYDANGLGRSKVPGEPPHSFYCDPKGRFYHYTFEGLHPRGPDYITCDDMLEVAALAWLICDCCRQAIEYGEEYVDFAGVVAHVECVGMTHLPAEDACEEPMT